MRAFIEKNVDLSGILHALCSQRQRFARAVLRVHVQVGARDSDRTVTQVCRHLPQVGACIERMAGEAMSQPVG